jgi:hypothetical protein
VPIAKPQKVTAALSKAAATSTGQSVGTLVIRTVTSHPLPAMYVEMSFLENGILVCEENRGTGVLAGTDHSISELLKAREAGRQLQTTRVEELVQLTSYAIIK